MFKNILYVGDVDCEIALDEAANINTDIMNMPIVIEDHVWVGMNVMILKGVTIGEGAIIAAGSVVIKDIPENCIAGGNPCRVIKTID